MITSLVRIGLCASVIGLWCTLCPCSADSPARSVQFGRRPLTFEKNTGRYDKRVKFLTRTDGATVFLTSTEAVMVLRGRLRAESQEARGESKVESGKSKVESRKSKVERGEGREARGNDGRSLSALSSQLSASSHVLRMKLVGANPKAVASGLEKQSGIVNYFIGNDHAKWRTRVPTYARARIAGVYPGIDLVYYGADVRAIHELPLHAAQLEYDFIVHPGADPKRIQLAFDGADRIRVADGDLILSTPAGDVRMKRPYAYQTIDGKRVQIACDYRLIGRRARLHLARYDASKPLVVDPVLQFSTYLGGSHDDFGYAVATDQAQNVYVAGGTWSLDFPTTSGAFDRTLAPAFDGFIVKLSPDGGTLLYATYIGGSVAEEIRAITVDALGALYATGWTSSCNYPTTTGASQTSCPASSQRASFVTKVHPSGAYLTYSTFFGGNNVTEGRAIAVDDAGCAYATGNSSSTNLPAAGFDPTPNGGPDAYVVKVNPAGSGFVYCTHLGGSGGDYGRGIALLGGQAYIAGETSSSDFPISAGAFSSLYSGSTQGFAAALAADGSALLYSTFIGAGSGHAVAVNASGEACVAGSTSDAAFPTTPGAFSRSIGGLTDAFVTSVNASGTDLVWSTLLGGPGPDSAYGIALSAQGPVIVGTAGEGLPVTPNAHQSALQGASDAFVATLTADGSALSYATYLGGEASDAAHAVAVDGTGGICVSGVSDGAGFPTRNALYPDYRGGMLYGDAWVAKLAMSSVATTLTVDSAAGVSGADVELQATLLRADISAPLVGRSVAFILAGAEVGTGVTNDEGIATLSTVISPDLDVGAFPLRAVFEGDDPFEPARSDGTLTITGYSMGGRVTDAGVGVPDVAISLNSEKTVMMSSATDARDTIGDYATLRSYLALTGEGVVNGLSVSVNIPHQAIGDLIVTLTHPDGTPVVLHNRTGGVADNLVTTYPDSTAPYGDLGLFDGKPAAGTWMLTVQDQGIGNTGVFRGWSLAVSAQRAEIVTVHTGTDGFYSVHDLPARTFEVLPALSGAVFEPAQRSVALGPDRSDVDFEIVVPGDTSLTASDRSGTISDTVTLRGYLRRVSDGAWLVGKTVQFAVDGTGVGSGTTNADGRADLNWVIAEGPASRTILAEFAGDGAYNPSSGTATLTCLSWTTKMASFDRTARITDRTELKARLLRSDNVPLYNKSVNFYVDGTFIITRPTNVEGYASYPFYDVPDGAGAGVRTILSDWPGNAGYAAISKTATLTVLKAIPYIWVLPKSVPQGSIANLYAYFRRLYDYQKQEGKTVDFKLDGTVIQTVVTGSGDQGGVARYLYPTTEAPGVYKIRCEFYGDAWLEPGYGEANLMVY